MLYQFQFRFQFQIHFQCRSSNAEVYKRLFLTTLWLGPLYPFKMWLDEYFLNSWYRNRKGSVKVCVRKCVRKMYVLENVLGKCKCCVWPSVLIISEKKVNTVKLLSSGYAINSGQNLIFQMWKSFLNYLPVADTSQQRTNFIGPVGIRYSKVSL